MSFISEVSTAFGEFKASVKTKPTSKDVAILQVVTQDEYYGRPPAYNAVALAKLYEENPWARIIVSKIAQGVARQRWYFEDKQGERIDDHPALDFLRAGCRGLRGRKAIRATQVILELQGECFWIIGRNAAGEPVGFAPVPAHWVLDTPGKTFKGFRIQPRSGVAFEVGEADVIHFREPNPVDPYGRGVSIANAARVELEADQAAANFLNSFFANRARPDYILSGTEAAPLGDVDVARLQEVVSEKFRGAKRAGRPLITANPLTLTTINSGLRDNQATEIRQLGKETIAEIWGVPPEIFGRLDSSNKATIDNADALFGKHTVDPRLAFLEDDIQPFVVENFDCDGLELRYENPVQDDKAFALEAVKARGSAFTNNEVRKLANHKALEGQDELPEPVDVNPDDDGDKPTPPNKPGKKKPGEKAQIEAARKVLTFDDVVSVANAIDDPTVKAEVTQLFNAIFAELVNKLGSELVEVLEAEADFQVYGRVAEFVAQEVPDLVGRIDATTRKELIAALTEGAAATEAVAELVARVEGVFAEAAKIRGSMIADTVATKLTGFVSLEAAQQAGFPQKKWLSSRDNVVRSTHRSLDGQIKPTVEPFQSASGARAMHPGAFGVAAEDVNCRCAMRPVLEGEKAAPVTDDEYEAEYQKRREYAARAIAKVSREVFAGQAAVVVAELKRLGALT